jgi:hypothetical protein
VRVQPSTQIVCPIVSWRTSGLTTPGVRVQLADTPDGAVQVAPDGVAREADAEQGDERDDTLHAPRIAHA